MRAKLVLLVFGVWTVIGLIGAQTWVMAVQLRGGAAPWGPILTYCLASVWLWALFSFVILWAIRRWPVARSRRRLRALGVHALLALGLSLMGTLLLKEIRARAFGLERSRGVLEMLAADLTLDVFSYALVASCGSAGLLLQALRRQEAKAATLAAQLATAQLATLRSQLQPHFFFNTLNTIAELVHRNPVVAERMIEQLGALMRRSFEMTEAQEVPLQEELKAVSAYLDVMQARFPELEVEYDVQSGIGLVLVPPLLLQPLVENALRHGLEPRGGRGRVEVVVRKTATRIAIEVRDNGIGMRPAATATGVGLRNTRERLRQLYGEAATLDLQPGEAGGVIALVSLPLRGANPPALVHRSRFIGMAGA